MNFAILFFGGLLLIVVGFVLILINMAKARKRESTGKTIGGHCGGMAIMFVGIVVTLSGTIGWLIANFPF
ncbi:hypothetical protein GW927_04415 [Candidatus Pacearchaeota archaeon]|nr:hypothetical protein [Candidatus Pacearchaeota archaeon]